MAETKGRDLRGAKSLTFWALVVLTVVYFAGYFALVLLTQKCDVPLGAPDAPTLETIATDFVGCRTVNELGDALAGAFAPVAFLWLAGAVFIQSKELEAQREELRDTRKVMKEQVGEAKAATALLTEQTGYHREQNDARRQEREDHKFDTILKNLASYVAFENGLGFNYDRPNEPNGHTGRYVVVLTDSREMYLQLLGLSEGLQACVQILKTDQSAPMTTTPPRGTRQMQQRQTARSHLHELAICSSGCSPAYRLRAQALSLERSIRLLDEVIDLTSKVQFVEQPSIILS